MDVIAAAMEWGRPDRLTGVRQSWVNALHQESFEVCSNRECFERLASLQFGSAKEAEERIKMVESDIKLTGEALATLYRRLKRDAEGPGTNELKRLASHALLRWNMAHDSVFRKNQYLSGVSSFRRSIYLNTRRNQLAQAKASFLGRKLPSYAFMDILGVRRPKTSDLFTSSTAAEHVARGLENWGALVVKPAQSFSAVGAYVVTADGGIMIVRDRVALESIDALLASMRGQVRTRPLPMDEWFDGRVGKDEWFAEELITDDKTVARPAGDLKFYVFYGEVVIVHETQRYPEKRYCWWNAAGERIDTGIYKDIAFDGYGFTSEQLRIAESVGAEIPLPFIRIDFLRTRTNFAFGEFGMTPGKFTRFDPHLDQMLGECYLSAEGRLYRDLLEGKKFAAYRHASAAFSSNRKKVSKA
jgi:hypothetical protein